MQDVVASQSGQTAESFGTRVFALLTVLWFFDRNGLELFTFDSVYAIRLKRRETDMDPAPTWQFLNICIRTSRRSAATFIVTIERHFLRCVSLAMSERGSVQPGSFYRAGRAVQDLPYLQHWELPPLMLLPTTARPT